MRRLDTPRSSRPSNGVHRKLSVYDGASFVGTIIVYDDHHFDAYDTADKLIGVFATQRKASRALPRNAEGTSR